MHIGENKGFGRIGPFAVFYPTQPVLANIPTDHHGDIPGRLFLSKASTAQASPLNSVCSTNGSRRRGMESSSASGIHPPW